LLSKTPVITANTSSLPEAGGPTSIYVDPSSPEEIAEAIQTVVTDKALQDNMAVQGFEYAQSNFSAKATSQQLLNCYQALFDK